MRRKMAVISVFIIGVSCCSLGMSAEASQNEKDSVKMEEKLEENTFKKNYLFGKNKESGMNGIEGIKLEDSHNLLNIGQRDELESDIDWFGYGNLDSAKIDLGSLEEDEDDSERILSGNNEKDTAEDEISKEAKELSENEEDGDKKNRDEKLSEMKDLQIPQKLDVVIDPWEMDGKKQVYSEEYTIKNTGKLAGILTLSSLICKPQEKSSAVVRMDREGLHDNEEKSIYIEMIFGNDGRIILSETGSEYQEKLEPGEELSFRFAGEVNEYAEDKWTDEDIKVDMVYSWSVETAEDDIDGQNINKIDAGKGDVNTVNEYADIDKNITESTDSLNEDTREYRDVINKNDVAEDAEDVKEDSNENMDDKDCISGTENEVSDVEDTERKEFVDSDGNQIAADSEREKLDNGENLPKIEEFSYKQSADETQDKKIEIIDLQKMKKSKLMIDSWTEDEGVQDEENLQDDQNKQEDQRIRITSLEYVLRNTGETAGTLILTGLRCKAQEQSGITVTENQEELNNSAGRTVYIEMAIRDGENEEKKSLSQEGSEYQVELEPGREISIRFVGEMKEGSDENWENGNVEVEAVCLWRL